MSKTHIGTPLQEIDFKMEVNVGTIELTQGNKHFTTLVVHYTGISTLQHLQVITN